MSDRRPRRARRFLVGIPIIVALVLAVLGLRWATAPGDGADGPPRYALTNLDAARLPPWWAPHRDDERAARDAGTAMPRAWFGTDRLGRDVLARCIVGAAISLAIGLGAAAAATVVGTLWGALAGSAGGAIGALMMRTVDVLQGLPTILLVVLVVMAADGLLLRTTMAGAAEASGGAAAAGLDGDLRATLELVVLGVAIGAVSWLTMARVVRSRTLTIAARPFMEASRAAGISAPRRFVRHLLPNLAGVVVVYATLAVPAAILSETFLSFLGLGVREPLPSLGSLAADGVAEINPVRPRWWLLVFPCGFVAIMLPALHAWGERVRRRITGSARSSGPREMGA